MTPYAINVREAQIEPGSGALKLPRFTLKNAFEIAWHEVLLFASRDEGQSGYFGTAVVGEPRPIPKDSNYLLPLYKQRPLERPLSLDEKKALGFEELPFSVYSRPIRQVESSEFAALLQKGSITVGFGENQQPLFLPETRVHEVTEAVQLRAPDLRCSTCTIRSASSPNAAIQV